MELFLEPRDMAQMRAARSKPKCVSYLVNLAMFAGMSLLVWHYDAAGFCQWSR